MDKPPFQLGDTVYVVQECRSMPVEKTCPVCFGKMRVTVILGNGKLEDTLCEYCGKGYEGPRGYVVDYELHSAVRQAIITGASFTNQVGVRFGLRPYGHWRIRTLSRRGVC